MIKNLTRKRILARNYKRCESIFSKTVGLMFSKKYRSLIFIFPEEKVVPLHMFFVFYPIDVLFLDKKKRVVEIKENFRPFSFYSPKNRAKYVIELPNEKVKKTGTKLGDKIVF